MADHKKKDKIVILENRIPKKICVQKKNITRQYEKRNNIALRKIYIESNKGFVL